MAVDGPDAWLARDAQDIQTERLGVVDHRDALEVMVKVMPAFRLKKTQLVSARVFFDPWDEHHSGKV